MICIMTFCSKYVKGHSIQMYKHVVVKELCPGDWNVGEHCILQINNSKCVGFRIESSD